MEFLKRLRKRNYCIYKINYLNHKNQSKPWGSSVKDNNFELMIISNFTLYG